MKDLTEHHLYLEISRDEGDGYRHVAPILVGVGLAVVMVIIQGLGLQGPDMFNGFIIGELLLCAALVALYLRTRRRMNEIDRSYAIRHLCVVGRKPAKPLKRRILK
ncbi:hypothetical protein [Sphingomonas sp.]|uniref:hypothetical protein n=1 Tax=Sphingomonas sp. TaxID=28214 RepID=UPI003D6CC619